MKRITKMRLQVAGWLCVGCTTVFAAVYPDVLTVYSGTTPTLDGVISEGEYSDCEWITGVSGWNSDTGTASTDAADLSVKIGYKHDGKYLYFVFDVTDDVLYGYDTEKWVPDAHPDALELSYEDGGMPFFGDGLEIFMNAACQQTEGERATGDGTSWQMFCSTQKSSLGGKDSCGLIEGIPFSRDAWKTYKKWIKDGAMKAAVRLKSKEEGRGYVAEWRIQPNPCLQIDKRHFVDFKKENKVGLNIEFQDLDEKEKGGSSEYHFHHVDYLSKQDNIRKADYRSFATLRITPDSKPSESGK